GSKSSGYVRWCTRRIFPSPSWALAPEEMMAGASMVTATRIAASRAHRADKRDTNLSSYYAERHTHVAITSTTGTGASPSGISHAAKRNKHHEIGPTVELRGSGYTHVEIVNAEYALLSGDRAELGSRTTIRLARSWQQPRIDQEANHGST